MTEIVRKGSKTPVYPGDVLIASIGARGVGPSLWIKVCCIKDGIVWGRECDSRAEPFGSLLAFRPEDVGCEKAACPH